MLVSQINVFQIQRHQLSRALLFVICCDIIICHFSDYNICILWLTWVSYIMCYFWELFTLNTRSPLSLITFVSHSVTWHSFEYFPLSSYCFTFHLLRSNTRLNVLALCHSNAVQRSFKNNNIAGKSKQSYCQTECLLGDFHFFFCALRLFSFFAFFEISLVMPNHELVNISIWFFFLNQNWKRFVFVLQ